MNKIVYILLFLTTLGYSQIIEPVKWTTEIEKVSASEYNLIFKAEIDPDYHLYSLKVPENGPLPTVFFFEDSDDYELVGSATEEKGHTKYDPVFKLEVKSFDTKTTFVQKIRIKNKGSFKIIGEIEFMACNDTLCVSGYEDIEFEI